MPLQLTKGEWQCPFCKRSQIVEGATFHLKTIYLDVGDSREGRCGLAVRSVRCANPACNNISVTAALRNVSLDNYQEVKTVGTILEEWQLRPGSVANILPDYIPVPLREDYVEACKIRDLSPKAAATLARRCLQGMIRDFCGISKSRLVDEIKELRKLADAGTAPKGVEAETLDAMDHVRHIGNIGAHMEADINHIIDVDPGEAQALIELIEMLFDEWYIARRAREDRLAKIKGIAEAKKNAKSEKPDKSGLESMSLADLLPNPATE